MNMEEIVARGRRAHASGDVTGLADAVADLRAWMETDVGENFLLAVLTPPPPRRGILGRTDQPVMLPVSRVAVPATVESLGELRASLVGVHEHDLSRREIALVDGEMLEWAEWDPMRRTLTTEDGVGIVVPEHVTMQQAGLALLNCQIAMWPEVYLPQHDEEEEYED